MYIDNSPWLMPKKSASSASSAKMIFENVEFIPNKRNDITKHPEKQIIIDLRTPNESEIHPDINPPVIPPAPRSIMAIPSRPLTSPTGKKSCTHDATQEKMPHKPISIEPKMAEPFTRLGKNSGLLVGVFEAFVSFQLPDSDSMKSASTPSNNGSIPI